MSQSRRDKQIPYRVLAWILYGDYPFIVDQPSGHTLIHIGPMARKLRTTNHRLRKYLRWLSVHGYLAVCQEERGTMTVATFESVRAKTWLNPVDAPKMPGWKADA